MYKILTLNKISENGLKKFPETYTYSSEEANPDAILVRSASMWFSTPPVPTQTPLKNWCFARC